MIMKRINIITVDNKSGLTRDATIIAQTLRNAGFKVSIYELGKSTLGHKIQRLTSYLDRVISHTLRSKPPYDVNLFIEYVIPSWFSYAQVNCLIPNQEWFRDEWRSYLNQFDYILCKTKFAQNIFDQLGCKTKFISFTSLDRFNKKYTKNYDRFFHLAGSNLQKGTKTIIDVWQKNPRFAPLTIIQNPQKAQRINNTDNIEHITQYMDDKILLEYQNSYGIHLCPSEAEGFGHYLVEAMSCEAVTITTNAPPMNEIITPVRGLLADYSHTKPHKLGINYYVDPQSLEQKINEILDMNYSQKKQLGENARSWYLDNDKFFRQSIVEVIASI